MEREAIVVFTSPVLDQPEIYIWNKMMNAEAVDTAFVNGDWIVDPISRQDWIDRFDPKKFLISALNPESDEESFPDDGLGPFRSDCQCKTLHDLSECALKQVPIETMCFETLLLQGRDRSVGSFKDSFDEAEEWDDLPNNCKRVLLHLVCLERI